MASKTTSAADLLRAAAGSKMTSTNADSIAEKPRVKGKEKPSYSTRKDVSGLNPEWERFFDANLKGNGLINNYNQYIKTAIYEKLQKDGMA